VKRLYYFREYYPREGTIITRIEYIDVSENTRESIKEEVEQLPGFREWCK